jgi:hypothetical protein
MRNACRISVGELDEKTSLGRPRHRWQDNIKTCLREIGWEGVNWILLAQDRGQWRAVVINTEMNVRFYKSETSLD